MMKTLYEEEILKITKESSNQFLGEKVIIHHANEDLQIDDLSGIINEIEYADNFPFKPVVLNIINTNGIKKSIGFIGIKKIEFLNLKA